MEILNFLNNKFNHKYNFLRVLKVEYNTLLSYAEISFLYPETIPELEEEDRIQISNAVTEELKLSCDIKYKFKKSYLDENLIQKQLFEFLKETYS